MENHVTSLQLSKKLKELGVKQESLFYYIAGNNDPFFRTDLGLYNSRGMCVSDTQFEYMVDSLKVSAFTVAELGEMFPQNIQLPFKKDGLAQEYWYWSSEKGRHREDTEADARAKMLIYLLEQGIIKVEDINK